MSDELEQLKAKVDELVARQLAMEVFLQLVLPKYPDEHEVSAAIERVKSSPDISDPSAQRVIDRLGVLLQQLQS